MSFESQKLLNGQKGRKGLLCLFPQQNCSALDSVWFFFLRHWGWPLPWLFKPDRSKATKLAACKSLDKCKWWQSQNQLLNQSNNLQAKWQSWNAREKEKWLQTKLPTQKSLYPKQPPITKRTGYLSHTGDYLTADPKRKRSLRTSPTPKSTANPTVWHDWPRCLSWYALSQGYGLC